VEGDVTPTIVGVRKLGCLHYPQWRPHDPIFIHLGTQWTDGQIDGIAVAIKRLALDLCSIVRKINVT